MGHVQVSLRSRSRSSWHGRRTRPSSQRSPNRPARRRRMVSLQLSLLSGDHHLCAHTQGTIVGRYGGFADRLRAQWTWARPLPDALDLANAGPLLCGGITAFSPLLKHNLLATAKVGGIGIEAPGHMALRFANKSRC